MKVTLHSIAQLKTSDACRGLPTKIYKKHYSEVNIITMPKYMMCSRKGNININVFDPCNNCKNYYYRSGSSRVYPTQGGGYTQCC